MHPMTNRILVNLLQTCCRPTTWPWTSPSQNTCHESRAPAEAQNAMLLPLEEQPKHPRLAGKRMCRCVTAPKPYVLRRNRVRYHIAQLRWLYALSQGGLDACLSSYLPPAESTTFLLWTNKILPDIFYCAGVQHCALHAKQAQSLRCCFKVLCKRCHAKGKWMLGQMAERPGMQQECVAAINILSSNLTS